ncbi:putative DsbA family dithiol-disulfide isomerase [Evansella vedderi]|uniref:DsbA family dithiol-disulfide isomerase n=1 Tax=Evansella vedderi TaxID=38282 RepID=A0ABT9ZUX1_9BACI|nr:putative DsbA family dithiol-disulfide isomerase [Evansella vedderi]
MVYRCFELDPTAERDIDYNIYEKLASKYGMSVEQARGSVQNMVKMAKEAGLDFQMDTLVLTNTFDAHRLTMFAKRKGLMQEMTERILKAHFTESMHIGDHTTLVNLAAEVGLNREEVSEMLKSTNMSEEVQKDKEAASKIGVNSVPFFLVNRKYAITGAQPTNVFVEALQKIKAEDVSLGSSKEQEGVRIDSKKGNKRLI